MNEIGKELVAKYYQALADVDVEAFLSIQQDDVVYNVNGNTPVSGRFTGKDFLQNVVAPEVFEFLDSTLAQRALWDNRLAEPETSPERQFEF